MGTLKSGAKSIIKNSTGLTMRELRFVGWDDVDEDNTNLLSLRVVYCGLCPHEYAAQQGFHWKAKAGYLFGGYWVNAAGECLVPA